MKRILNGAILCFFLSEGILLSADDPYPQNEVTLLSLTLDEFESQVFRLKKSLLRIEAKLNDGTRHPQFDMSRLALLRAIEESIRIREKQYAIKNASSR